MALVTAVLSLVSLLGWCLFLSRRAGLSPSLAPLAAVSVLELAMLFAGMAGLLRPATWALLALGWALAAAAALSRRRARAGGVPFGIALARRGHAAGRGVRRAPGAALFWGGAAVLALRLCTLGAQFVNFDEYSFWGTAAKLTVLNGRLYTECAFSVPWQITQYGALPLAAWWFAPFGRFSAWGAIFAADVVLLAGLAALLGAVQRAGRRVWGPLALAVLAAPTVFSASGHTSNLCTAWLEVLGDVPAGVLFGAAAAYWLAVREQGAAARWLTLPVVCLAANIKQNTFVLALAAAGLAAADALLFPAGAPESKTAPGTKKPAGARLGGAGKRLAFAAAVLAAPALQYQAWSRYTAALVAKNQAAGGMGETSEPLVRVLANGLRMLLGGQGSAYYEQRRGDLFAYAATMRDWFFTRSVSLLGSGAAVCAVIGAVFALAVLLAGGRREKLRWLGWAAGSGLCFGGYWVLLLLSYAFVLKDSSPDSPASYGRYFLPFYLGWLLLAAACLGQSAAGVLGGCRAAAPARRPDACAPAPCRALLARGAALALGVCLAAALALGTEPQNTVLGVPRAAYDGVRARATLAHSAALAAGGGAVFLVSQGDNGYDWFSYAEAMLPAELVYGTGGGTFGAPEYAGDTPYYQAYTAADFLRLVQESGAQYLLAAKTDECFAQSYGALFSDGLALAQAGPALYKVSADGFAPYCALAGEGAGA